MQHSFYSPITLNTKLTLVFSACLALINCGSVIKSGPQTASQNSPTWLSSGELSFGAPMPPPVSIAVAQDSILPSNSVSSMPANSQGNKNEDFAYGFAPTAVSETRSLVISTSQKNAVLLQSGRLLASVKILDTNGFEPGVYRVAHKQRNPVWYAPEGYFMARGCTTPPEGDKQRYLRGVFGDYALFISPNEAIHAGPYSMQELSGIRVEEQDFAKIFYLVEAGDSITVQ